MKKIFISAVWLFIGRMTYAQAPKAFNYQAVIRSSDGEVVKNKLVSMQLGILKLTASGDVVYSERHNLTTNDNGMVNLFVGQGTIVSGQFSNIDWAKGEYFLKIELDIDGGTNFTEIGTSKLLSVPYAFYADKAKTATDDKDMSPTNELQNLSRNGDTLSISNGNKVVLPKQTWENVDGGILYEKGLVQIGKAGIPFSEITQINETTASDADKVSFKLPDGYAISNTRVLSVEILKTVMTLPGIGVGKKIISYAYGLGYTIDGGSISYYLYNSNISTFPIKIGSTITVNYPNSLRNMPIRIMLMKVD